MSNRTMHYTPFECFPVAVQTASGLLQLEPNEVTILHRANLQIRSAMGDPSDAMTPLNTDGTVDTYTMSKRKWQDRCDNLLLQLTTHRIVFWKEVVDSGTSGSNNQQQQSQSQREGRYLSFSIIFGCTAETEWFKSPKILLNSAVGDILLVFPTGNQGQAQRDEVLQQIEKAMTRKEWEKSAPSSTQGGGSAMSKLDQTTKALTSHKVGVDAILARNKIKHQQAQQLTDQVMSSTDAESLIREATELVKIIHRYVATLERATNQGNASTGSGGGSEEESAQLVSMLQGMGMTSALNKSDFDGQLDAYYEQLARQIADVMRDKLRLAGGVLTLTDVYCLFNRARASNLLSPEDLLAAVAVLDKPATNLGMRTRTFPSGLIVLELNDMQDAMVRLRDAAAGAAHGITDLDAARILNVSALLAHEQLFAAEQAGHLVRDECLQTTRYYPNRFEEWALQLSPQDSKQ